MDFVWAADIHGPKSPHFRGLVIFFPYLTIHYPWARLEKETLIALVIVINLQISLFRANLVTILSALGTLTSSQSPTYPVSRVFW